MSQWGKNQARRMDWMNSESLEELRKKIYEFWKKGQANHCAEIELESLKPN